MLSFTLTLALTCRKVEVEAKAKVEVEVEAKVEVEVKVEDLIPLSSYYALRLLCIDPTCVYDQLGVPLDGCVVEGLVVGGHGPKRAGKGEGRG
jgi:hypothetical protein